MFLTSKGTRKKGTRERKVGTERVQGINSHNRRWILDKPVVYRANWQTEQGGC